MYPRLWNLSAGFIYKAAVRAEDPAQPEYVPVPLRVKSRDLTSMALSVAVSKWNMLWEAAQFRRRFFGDEELPPP